MPTVLYAHAIAETLIPDLPEIRGMSFDVVYTANIRADEASVPDVLDACQDNELKCILNVRYAAESMWPSDPTAAAAELTRVAGLYGAHPAFYGWYTCDEADGSSYDATAREGVYALLKSLTPDALIFEAEYANISDSYRASGTHDVFAGDLYPFQTGRTIEQALGILHDQTGAIGRAAGTVDFLSEIGGGAADLSWCIQTWAQTSWPQATGVTQEIALIEADGWLTSGHLWAFVWIDDSYPEIPSANTLRQASAAFKDEVRTAFAPYQDVLYLHDFDIGMTALVADRIDFDIGMTALVERPRCRRGVLPIPIGV